MTLPPLFVDLFLDGAWTEVTGDVRIDGGIRITRGRQDEGSRVGPGKARTAINNKAGKYSPRNPTSPLYGKIGRNTPARIGRGVPPAGTGTFVNTSAADETTDLSHDAPSVNARAAGLLLCSWLTVRRGDYTVPGSMTLDAETDSDFSTMATAREPLAASGATGTRTATFTLDPDMVVFAHAHASIAIPGTPVVEEFIADAARDEDITVRTGDAQAGWWLVAMQGWAVDNFDTMPFYPGGTQGEWRLVADTIVATDDGPHVRAWARPVTVAGVQEVFFPTADHTQEQHVRVWVVSGMDWSSVRLAGEVAAWPQRWDPSEADVWVPIEVAGIKRRLGARRKPLHSAIYRETLSPARRRPVAYWPCEDAAGSRFLASALDGGTPMSVVDVDAANLASFDGFAGSDPIPVLNTARFYGDVPAYTPTGETQARWLISVDDGGANDNQPILTLHTDNSLRWEVVYHTTGDLSVDVYGPDADGDIVQIHTSGNADSNIDGLRFRMSLELTQNGSNVDYTLVRLAPGAETGTFFSGTVTGRTVGRVRRANVGAGRNLGNVAVGHVSVHDEITSIFDLGDALIGWAGEPAGRRFIRLCREEGIPAIVTGDAADTIVMGPQRANTFLELLEECATADGGILHETRDDLGLSYRTRMSLYNQGQT